MGLDGFNDATVEQDGTFAYCSGPQSTKPVYKAWYEMYPSNSVNVFTVHRGMSSTRPSVTRAASSR